MSSIIHDNNLTIDWEESVRRQLKNYQYYFPSWGNSSSSSNYFQSNLTRPEDVSVDAVVSSLYFNTIVFICLMGSYELLRRLLPAVYSSRQRQLNTRGWQGALSNHDGEETDPDHSGYVQESDSQDDYLDLNPATSLTSLPDQRPLDWIGPVFGIPWEKVRQKAGLDGYFFLRCDYNTVIKKTTLMIVVIYNCTPAAYSPLTLYLQSTGT
jgi:Late exocytosis, associated with Golgi transport